jgi:hypothetical protein
MMGIKKPKLIGYFISKKKHRPNWQMLFAATRLLSEWRPHWITWVYSGIPSAGIDRLRNKGIKLVF